MTLIDEAQSDGLTEAQAIWYVEIHFIGVKKPRRGQSTLYASPEALLMLDLEHKDYPKEKWRSGSQLTEEYKGARATLEQKLDNFRTTLIADIVAAGIEEEIASEVVQRNFVRRINRLYDADPVCASPAAVRLLEDEGILRRKSKEGPSR